MKEQQLIRKFTEGEIHVMDLIEMSGLPKERTLQKYFQNEIEVEDLIDAIVEKGETDF